MAKILSTPGLSAPDPKLFTPVKRETAVRQEIYERSALQAFLHSLRQNPASILCLAILCIIILASLCAPLSPYNPDEMDLLNKMGMPSLAHPFGTDEMGRDEHPDILNIVLDTPRKISERFGPESVEYEDMLYRLDRDIEEFISFLLTQVEDPSQVVVTLTSDHGTSPSFDSPAEQQERFNVRQAEVITNAFIGAQHGNGEWILGYIDRAFYLNHNLIYEKGLSIADMQHDVATFLMQLRGVSHAVSAEALRSTYFGSGYGRKVQNGFYPRRSGDVVVNLMPDWIEERDSVRSMSGSMYRYDTHVPLVIFGGGITAEAVDTPVDMISLAPTLARMLHIDAPSAAEGTALEL